MSGTKMMKDMKGQRFERLIVLYLAPEYDKAEGAYWICQCDCGSEPRKVKGYFFFLRSGKTRSCGCLHHEELSKRVSGVVGQAAATQCFNNYKHLAHKRGIAFELSKEEFLALTKGNCFYCGCAPYQIIKVPSENGEYVYNGVDRLDNEKTYVSGNCVSCCGVHNKMKLEMSVPDFIAACRAVVMHFDSQS